jgi:hypothetical protein
VVQKPYVANLHWRRRPLLHFTFPLFGLLFVMFHSGGRIFFFFGARLLLLQVIDFPAEDFLNDRIRTVSRLL